MKDADKTKEQLINELMGLRQRIEEVEKSESERNRARERTEDLMRFQRDLGLAISSEVSLEQTIELCLNAAIRVSGMDCGTVYTVDGTSGNVDLVFHKGLSDYFINSVTHYDADTANAQMVMAGKPIYMHYQTMDAPMDDTHDREGLRAIAVIPVYHDGQVIACLNIASHTIEEVPVFARDALETIAVQIGSAIAQKKANEALQESEHKYRTMVEQSNDMIWTLDKDGNFSFFNKRCEEISAHRLEGWQGKSFVPLIMEEDLPLVMDVFQRTLKGKPQQYEVRVKGDNRDILTLSVNTAPILKAGTVVGTVSFGRDITKRKWAEQALRESEERYQALFETAQDSVFMSDETGRFVDVNQAACKSLGYTKEELLELCNRDIDADPRGWEAFVKVRDGQLKGMRFEVNQLRKDGTHLPVEVTGSFFTRGDQWFFMAIARDITDRKRAEKALRESEKRYREMTDLLPQIVYEIDERGVITFVNRIAFEVTGYTQEEFDKNPLTAYQTLISEDQDRCKENIQRVLGGENIGGSEYTAQRKDGSTFPVVIYSSPIIRKNRPVGVRGILVDLTEHKRLEEQLRQAQKMEAIGTLAGGIVHDFNNILAAIIGYVEIGDFNIAGGHKAKESIKGALNACQRAKDLVNQILIFSRPGEQELKPTKISMIVKEALKLLRISLPTTIEILQNLEIDTDIVEVDPIQIHQVLMNLFTNAAYAMKEKGGVLEVSLKTVELKVDEDKPKARLPVSLWGIGPHGPEAENGLKPGPYLRLTVRDTGEGVTTEVLERIFDPYFTTKEKGVGTGLGLAVANGIVKDHGGIITIESEPGKGTTFHVYLPGIEHEDAWTETEVAQPIPVGHERILFTDDEQDLADIGKQMLEHLGYEVVTKTSNVEALDLFRSNPDHFDLVITDMTMPNMTGDELAKELMRIRPEIPIILCTGFNERITEEKAKEMGIRAFVMKPIAIRDFAEVIRSVMD